MFSHFATILNLDHLKRPKDKETSSINVHLLLQRLNWRHAAIMETVKELFKNKNVVKHLVDGPQHELSALFQVLHQSTSTLNLLDLKTQVTKLT